MVHSEVARSRSPYGTTLNKSQKDKCSMHGYVAFKYRTFAKSPFQHFKKKQYACVENSLQSRAPYTDQRVFVKIRNDASSYSAPVPVALPQVGTILARAAAAYLAAAAKEQKLKYSE